MKSNTIRVNAARFADDRERVEHLLARYEAFSALLLAAVQSGKPKRGRR